MRETLWAGGVGWGARQHIPVVLVSDEPVELESGAWVLGNRYIALEAEDACASSQ